jgi:UDPglucose--hexose-1-phosphate uridylyltransferase
MSSVATPHRRFNPLTGEWVLVSPQRTQRPWLGQQESSTIAPRPSYDPQCYLCPGNRRASGEVNPAYGQTFVFENDFAAILPGRSDRPAGESELFQVQPVSGLCRVLCFSPRHDISLAAMSTDEISAVVEMWVAQTAELSVHYRWVQIFENKGEVMGCSNPHPHGQVWAGDWLPHVPSLEDAAQRRYFAEKTSPLLVDYLASELDRGERVVEQNDHFVVLVPWWALWPFELLLLPRRHVLSLPELTSAERRSLAEILRRSLARYDGLFATSFPYSMGWHGAPSQGTDVSHWQLHAHFFPPLLRTATVKKFMVGYEMLADPQRDLTPERAAADLRAVSVQP